MAKERLEILMAFRLGEFVVLRHDPDRLRRMVTRVSIALGNVLLYELSAGTVETWHREEEIQEAEESAGKRPGFSQ
jgi:hypothetical protein